MVRERNHNRFAMGDKQSRSRYAAVYSDVKGMPYGGSFRHSESLSLVFQNSRAEIGDMTTDSNEKQIAFKPALLVSRQFVELGKTHLVCTDSTDSEIWRIPWEEISGLSIA